MKRRKKIRIGAFISALVLSLTAWATVSTVKAHIYKTQIDLNNEKALTELCEYMDSIEVALTKSLYAGTQSMLSTLTSELQRDSQGAKESLSSLNAGETQLYNTYKFLSQVGEFTASLNKKAALGEEITEKERETLRLLCGFAAELSLKFEHMASLLSADYFTFDEISQQLINTDTGSESTVSYLDSISDAELSFENFPSLIYDGPYSDNILTKESAILKSSKEISREKAREIAASALDTDVRNLADEEDITGKVNAFTFRTDTFSISVTKNGGFVAEILSDIRAGEEKLTSADAVEKASLYLNSLGYLNMVSTYYASSDGICTVNFAYKQGSFICYPDLIKVSVSLYDGRITGLEATDYLMNHIERDIPDFGITPEEAMENTVPSLKIKKVSAAVIPTKSGTERYTYELFCEDTDGQHILIYKDISDGKEADILILIYSDNGTLTK
ncbi:MAG: germination protein YpeB [Clostridia bacterium]|nr:germination protein YpeB [Clostridia bacterium]